MQRDPAPSWSDISAMMSALAPRAPAPPPAAPDTPTSKWVLGVISGLAVLFLGALGNFAASSIAGVGQIGPKIDTLKDSVGEIKKSVDVLTQQSNAQQIAIGKQDLRIGSLEQNQARLLDRMRAVEGGARIASPAPGSVGAP